MALYDLHKEEDSVRSTYENILSFYELLCNDRAISSFFNSSKIAVEKKYELTYEIVQYDEKLKTFANFLKAFNS
ncbi:F0F1 ATP synthase subunit delta [Mycoplasmopsis bovis]|nr:F0F1 ATP synthase subunit delta [Mycoplasmopsis bovis]